MVNNPLFFLHDEECFNWLFELVKPLLVARRNTRAEAFPFKAKSEPVCSAHINDSNYNIFYGLSDQWHFPHSDCAIDGKDMVIIKPPNNGLLLHYINDNMRRPIPMYLCTYVLLTLMWVLSVAREELFYPPENVLNREIVPYFVVVDDPLKILNLLNLLILLGPTQNEAIVDKF